MERPSTCYEMSSSKPKKSKKTPTIEEKLKSHYGKDFTIDDFPTWSSSAAWINTCNHCPVHSERQCDHCIRFCFSTELRGIPPRDLEWFLNVDIDAVYKLSERAYFTVKMEINKHLRQQEINLRAITRKDVLRNLIDRFRGQKKENDDIDRILQLHSFSSLEAWCDFKDYYDRSIIQVYEKIRYSDHYCTGCGVKVEQFTSKKNIEYEKCSLGRCDFFHRVGSNYATVKK